MLLPALALGAAAAFAASAPASCLKTSTTLDDFDNCQRRRLDNLAVAYARKHAGELPSDDALETWKTRMESERAKFLAAHPGQKPGQVVINLDGGDPPAAPSASPQAPATPPSAQPADAGADPRSLDDEKELQNKLLGATADGKPNLSGDGAQQINEYLNGKQGGASADMKGLMMELQQNGKPSDQSVQKLREAAGAMGGQPAPSVEPPDPRAQ